jgi:hypothetical protein
MTSQGTAAGRFQRAIQQRNIVRADLAARELGSLSLSEALSLCLLYEAEDDPRFERAFQRWLSRVRREKALKHEEVELLRAAAGALSTSFRAVALEALLVACRELGLPLPTPPQPSNSRAPADGQGSSSRLLEEGPSRPR